MNRLLLALVLLLTAIPQRADAVPLGVVIRGGGSLGAFEAGALYYLTTLAQHNADLVDIRLVTGTSAGSINGILTVLESCRPHNPDPTASLFYQVWSSLGIRGLFDGTASSTGVLTRNRAIGRAVEMLRGVWNSGLEQGCDVVLGIPVTRIVPRRVELAIGGQMPLGRVEERFVVRIRGRGPGRSPSMTNYVPHEAPIAGAALITDPQGEIDFNELAQVVMASSSVPIMFPTVRLSFCLVGARNIRADGTIVCDARNAEAVELVDGGLLDNQPLRLATSIAQRGFEPTAARVGPWIEQPLQWRAVPEADHANTLPPQLRFMLVDPAAMTWLPRTPLPSDAANSMADVLGRLLPGVLESAATSELQTVLEEIPDIREKLAVIQSDWPLASAPIGSLFGFLERDFRVFDFYLGMHEARQIALRSLVPWAKTQGREVVMPEARVPEAIDAAWRPFRCLRAAFVRGSEVETACAGLDANFLALTQMTLERAGAACRWLSTPDAQRLPEGPHDSPRACCRRANGGQATLALPGVPNGGLGKVDVKEGAVDEMLRLLSLHGFSFDDLGLGRADLRTAKAAVSALLHEMTRALADEQEEWPMLWRIGGRAASQGLHYRPPSHAFHALLGGTWEFGWSATVPDGWWDFLRFAVGLTMDGVPSLLDGAQTQFFGLTPSIGIELEAVGLSGPMMQFRVGLRGGFRLSTGDDFGASSESPKAGVPRTRPVAELYGSLTLLQWMRFQLGVSWFPPYEGLSGSYAVRPMLGIELDLPL